MFWNLFSNRSVFIGLVFFLFIVIGSLLYSWHVRRTTDAELMPANRYLQQIQKKNETLTTEKDKGIVDTETLEFSESSTETNETQAPLKETELLSVEEEKLVNDPSEFLSIETSEISEDVPASPYGVSPYGFGSYPEVPAGFPSHLQPIWTWSEEKMSEFTGNGKDFELMHRVLIKLWNQGDQGFVAVTRSDDNGKVYPIYPDVVYVTWREATDPHGNVHRYPGFTLAGPNVPRLLASDFTHGKGYPPHVTVLDRDEEGIEPYNFLNLQRR